MLVCGGKADSMRKVADFAEERNVDRNAVSQYIRRHGEDFKGHTKVDGHNLFFDEDCRYDC